MDLPRAFVSQMVELLGPDADLLLASLQCEAPVSLRLHPVKGNLLSFPKEAQIPWHTNGRYLPDRPVFTLDPAFHAGAYYVQEASSMFLGELLRQLTPHLERPWVLDLAAAPGGKSTILAEWLPYGGLLVANEPIAARQQVLRYNLVKWGYPQVLTGRHDPADYAPLKHCFDLVLVDAPCSGEGMFRKDPAARQEWSPAHVDFCSARQRRILSEAAELVQAGGYLIYSTCTYNRSENEAQVEWMMQTFGFEHITIDIEPEWDITESELGYRFYPHLLTGEGLYLAVLRKKEGRRRPSPPKSRKKGSRSSAQPVDGRTAAPWLARHDDFILRQHPNGHIRFWPRDMDESFAHLRSAMPTLRPIGLLGELKGKNLVPAPELALSLALSDAVPRVELSLQEARRYLKKESIQIDPGPADQLYGHWRLMTYHDLPLGWSKVLPRRVNNYYPKGWAIRMDLPDTGE